MKITLYFITWNDIFYLPFIKKHYGKFCQKIVMFDNYSSDGSDVLAKEYGFIVEKFGKPGVLDDEIYRSLKNEAWKFERNQGVDYVIVCDSDEFVSLPKEPLTASAPIVNGFNMISETLPVDDIFEINTGAPSESYSKQAIFSPDRMKEINYVHGCHKNYKVGEITIDGPQCTLHHFRQIGGVQRMLDRHALYRPRLSNFNLKHRMGFHYGRPEWNREQIQAFNESKIAEWNQLKAEARKLW